MPSICSICSRKTALFNYGVTSCNACKMFYRRALTAKKPKTCNCSKDPPTYIPNQMCGYCRLQKCRQVGMKCTLEVTNTLSVLINNLSQLDFSRHDKLMTCHVPENPSLGEAIKKSINFTKKPSNFAFSQYSQWSTVEQLSTIDFLKNLDISQSLSPPDQSIFVKNAYFPQSLFVNAMRNYQCDSDKIGFPNDIICPENALESMVFSDELIRRIQCRVVGRLIELKITNEEFLLLSVLFSCDPAVPDLSASAITLITNQRHIYSSALFQYCLIKYQKLGPTRFGNLLSLFITISASVKDITDFYVLYQICVIEPEWTAIFVDSLKDVLLI